MSSPWKITTADVSNGPTLSLNEIMSEELAKNLEEHEDGEIKKKLSKSPNDDFSINDVPEDFLNNCHEMDCSNDLLLAQYLQMEFDREHDKNLSLEETKLNGNNKVSISFENFRSTHPFEDADSSDSEDDDLKEKRNHKMDTRRPPEFGVSGVIKTQTGEYVTKHDKVISGRKNTSKVLDFPPEFRVGDAAQMDLQLSNRVYNSLKKHSICEEKRMNRLHEKKDQATASFAMDPRTRLLIYKMVNSELLSFVTGSISTGKEANVLHAFGGPSTEVQNIPSECALKVYKTTLSEFKNRCEYVKDDYRFNCKNPRKVLKIWAEKESMNLVRMRRAGIRCPSVVKLKDNVLVMSFIGLDGRGAPKLLEADLTQHEDQLRSAYDQCVDSVKLMYTKCSLVHGDLSEFNVLYWQDQCWIIDVSQSMDLSHPQSLVFLARDCHNLTKFFEKRGLDIPSDRQLFNDVTGLDMPSDKTFYCDVQEFVNENRAAYLRNDKKHPANSVLRKALQEEHLDATINREDFCDD